MKDSKRTRAAAIISNSPTGAIRVSFVDHDGGDFELHPKMNDTSLFLVDPTRPNGYGLEITGDVDALDRVAKALSAIVRSRRGESTDTPDTPDAGE